jgi:hypothetical protein
MLTCSTGCTQFDLKKRIPWGDGIDGEAKAPMKVVACWTDTVMQTEGKPSMRGFGGRLSFYTQSDIKPIKVDGSLVIYAFDETDGNTTKVNPDRKFVFDHEQLKKHHAKDDRGHSYSFWIPWDVAGGEQREISLIARFTPVEGGVVVSEQTRHLLPGTTPQITGTSVKQIITGPPQYNSAVQQAGFSEPAQGGPAPAERKMETTTIHLPRRLGLQQMQPNTGVQQPSQGTLLQPQLSPGASIAQGMVGSPPAGQEAQPMVSPSPQYVAQGVPTRSAAAAAGWTSDAPVHAGGFSVSVSSTPPA